MRCGIAILVVLILTASALALEPRQVLLIINSNVPQGRELAEYYADQRQIPRQQIVELNLPDREEISFDEYERQVVPPLREFLIRGKLHTQITCAVTFYGVPTRVAARKASPDDEREIAALREELKEVERQLEPLVVAGELIAEKTDPQFDARKGDSFPQLVERLDHVTRVLGEAYAKLTDPQQRQQVQRELQQLAAKFAQPMKLNSPGAATSPAEAPAEGAEAILTSPQWRRFDSDGRAAVRDAARGAVGVLDYGRLIDAQLGYLASKDTQAALDNELALLWWNLYPRQRWQINPLHVRVGQVRSSPVLMLMRLDGPSPEVVRRMIDQSIATEKQGLQGCVLLDSWNKPAGGKEDGYGQYDQTIRDLASLLRRKTSLKVILDEQDALVTAAPDDIIALYCGWYAPQEYAQPGVFAPGSVGYHIASFTMVTLHRPRAGDWVRSLLRDGIDATMGPVAEPYLHAFPRADEFFPLLLTGRLTLAEVVWKSNPLTSWQMSFLGDPLYTPYRNNPQLEPQDLPEALRKALPASAP